ncbi:hypothetical protein AURDEDRAFT_112264 [Auricularia subglabra TFB-10046 SS5]|nr:hypothetical protein AURDEDRAFT_112264 [Auricularia subglabra TFB-10046 SS5]
MAEDYTKRLPVETLHEIIDWVDEREAMHATAHVCRRWRDVAFDRPRRFCWFDCHYQFFPATSFFVDPPYLSLCLAQLKCRLKHPRVVRINLDIFDGDAADAVINLLASKIPFVEDLSVTWSGDELTAKVLRALSSHPAPLLYKLALKRESSDDIDHPSTTGPCSLPQNLFAGTSPLLHDITLSGVDLPEEPLPQLSAVTSVDVEPDSDPWCCQDLLARHFPGTTTLCIPCGSVVRLAVPTTTEGRLVLGRLTQLFMNERMLNNVLDEYPELSNVSSIIAWPDHASSSRFDAVRPLVAQTVARMLAHFAHRDFLIDITDTTSRDATSLRLVLSSDPSGPLRREIEVPLALVRHEMRAIFDNARADGHELRLTRAVLSGRTFTWLWPVLPIQWLRGVEVLADPALPDVPTDTPPRDVPALRDYVISRNLGMADDVGPIVLHAAVLAGFLRATLGRSIDRLRLAGVSVDEVSPEMGRMCTDVMLKEYLSLDSW